MKKLVGFLMALFVGQTFAFPIDRNIFPETGFYLSDYGKSISIGVPYPGKVSGVCGAKIKILAGNAIDLHKELEYLPWSNNQGSSPLGVIGLTRWSGPRAYVSIDRQDNSILIDLSSSIGNNMGGVIVRTKSGSSFSEIIGEKLDRYSSPVVYALKCP